MENLKKYWDTAVDFETYIKIAEERVNNPQTDLDKEKLSYNQLGLQRMNRSLKTFKADEELIKTLESKQFKGKILIISEPWCGDASATVPCVSEFFKGKNEVRIFFRDSDLSLIDQFLTDGTQSIPKLLILDENYEVLNTWGPRPKYGLELLKKFKADPEAYPRETFYNDLQVYYAKNRGKDVIEELLDLI